MVIFAINLALVVIHANDCWGTYLRLFVIFQIFAFSTSIMGQIMEVSARSMCVHCSPMFSSGKGPSPPSTIVKRAHLG